jgi:trk system potassium uptake protein TrkA
MNAVIMGGGRVGFNLASFLINDGYDVTVIENNPILCSDLANELDCLVICGNGTDMKILEEANLENADVFVATTGNDEANLLACILVNEFEIPKLIARVNDPSHSEAFKQSGIDLVISPEITSASYLEKLIIKPEIADLVFIGKGDAELLNIKLENEKIIGRKVSDLKFNDEFIIVGIYDKGDLTIPQPNMILERGMKVSILVKSDSVKNVMNLFINDNLNKS